jgi:hypothetical protein
MINLIPPSAALQNQKRKIWSFFISMAFTTSFQPARCYHGAFALPLINLHPDIKSITVLVEDFYIASMGKILVEVGPTEALGIVLH